MKTKENYSLLPPKLTVFFNSNIKLSIFVIHPTKFQFFSIRPILSQNFHTAPIFYFFINNNKKKTNLGMQKWPDGQKSGCSHIEFFFKIFIKKLGTIWEVFDTISQTEKKLELLG